MLHFGRKYEMRRLRQEAVTCLMLEFPSSLKQWTLQDLGNVIEGIGSEEEIPMISLFEILCLAHEHSVTSVLPALYLRICLTHNAVSRVVLFGFQVYLNSGIIVSTKSPRAFGVLQKNCLLITTNCYLTACWAANAYTDRSPP